MKKKLSGVKPVNELKIDTRSVEKQNTSRQSTSKQNTGKQNVDRQNANKQVGQSQQLDDRDRLLLQLLQENSRTSNAELARQLKLTAPGLQKRLKKLEDNGFIDRYVTLVNREALGFDLLCFAQVTLAHHQPECVGQFCQQVQGLPEVLECHHLTGEFDYLLKVVAPNRQRLEQLMSETITQLPGVDKVRTNIVLNEVKASTSLPLVESASST
ncbi:Lrp/AsnC family transcriptional regulator [Leptolyngbya ohadii]|uniref:Lrp/AsnC family transcriptional regulator n=1 Tax=Leptolyngbya ohadii TaxID=1962290 RepID=UPI001CED5F50|nr:Lrp/AsnC family transcriptional regulator [Leptolyngbya ohadii]